MTAAPLAEDEARRRPAGMVLTGGASRRMGVDKALIEVDGLPNARRLAIELGQVAHPVVEVGPGWAGTRLRAQEQPAGDGPLAAVCAGATALEAEGWRGAALVIACDMPFANSGLFGALAGHPSPGSVVPLVDGELQPLCARWSAEDLALARRLHRSGERAMKALLANANFAIFGRQDWPAWLRQDMFADIDTPQQAAVAGVVLKCG